MLGTSRKQEQTHRLSGRFYQFTITISKNQGIRSNKVIQKVTLSFTPIPSAFTPYPLFEWYPQSKEILLNLSMKCWNSAFNAQGSRVIIVVVEIGVVEIYVPAVEALRKEERGDKTQFITKLVEKLVWVSVILFCKLSFPVTHLMPYCSETGRFRPLIAWLYG